MAHIRFWHRFKILSWFFINLGKKGLSFSFGPRGIKYTKGTNGERISVGIPGTGIYYVDQKSYPKLKKKKANQIKNEDILKQLKGEENGKI